MLAGLRHQRLLSRPRSATGDANTARQPGPRDADCWLKTTIAPATGFLFFPHIYMVQTAAEAQRSASIQENATSSAQPVFSMSDGPLSVSFYARSNANGDVNLFVVPRREYKHPQHKTFSTHMLHQEDLFGMATLLMKAYSYVNTLKKPTSNSEEAATSESPDDAQT